MSCLCNCNNGSGSGSDNVIRHPQGNVLIINIPLTRRAVYTINGTTTASEVEFPFHDVVVSFIKNMKRYDYPARMSSTNVATIIDYGKLPVGTYSIEVTGSGTDGLDYRFKKNTVLMIVDSTEEGGVYETDEFNVTAFYPVVNGKTSAIIINDNDIVIEANGTYKGDDTPNDNFIDITAAFGDKNIEITDDEIIINI